jgi:hypothetical protein
LAVVLAAELPTWCNADGKGGGELTAAGVSQRP